MGLGLRSLSKRERSWVLYDVGNSAYIMLAATLIPIYFSAIAEPGSSAVVAWGYADDGGIAGCLPCSCRFWAAWQI